MKPYIIALALAIILSSMLGGCTSIPQDQQVSECTAEQGIVNVLASIYAVENGYYYGGGCS